MKHSNIIKVSAWSMIVFAALLVGISILVSSMIPGQPILFDLTKSGSIRAVAGTSTIQSLLSLYALLPLLLIPASVGSYYVFAPKYEANLRIGIYFATAGAIALSLSLMLLPSMSWHLLTAMQTLPVQQKPVIIAILEGTHAYLGTYVGEFLGMGCILVWVLTTSILMLKTTIVPRGIAIVETALAVIIAAFLVVHYTNLFPKLSLMVQVNIILALWVFLCGITFLVMRKR